MQEKLVAPSIRKGGKAELWRSCCGSLQDSKLYPAWRSKAAILLVVVLLFLGGLIIQDLMVDNTDNSVSLVEMVMDVTRSINPVKLQPEITTKTPPDSIEDDVLRLMKSPAAKCLSRDQHMLHRPASQIIPFSPNLVSAIKAYEKRHAECSRSVGQNWTETFLHSLNGSSHHNTEGCKFMVYIEGGAGLGNRLISLVSAFVFALFTDRILLVESSCHVANLLCEPFPESSWILPQGFPVDLLYASPDVNLATATDFTEVGNVLKFNLDHSQNWGDQQFFCSETRERIQEIEWVMWTSNQYLVPRLLTFPEFWPRLSTLFPNPSHVFTHLGRYLLLPNNILWEKIFRIYSSYLSSAGKLVGIQIRRHSVADTGEFSALAFERVLNCLMAHKILPNISSDESSFPNERLLEWMMKMRSPSSSRRVAKSLQQQQHQENNGGPDVTAVLIASLQQRYAEELQDLYTNFPTVDGSLVRVHIVSHDGMEWHSYDQAQKAFVEMWLLSLSDTIATSSWSTFGYVAHGLGAMKPYIVNLRGDLDPKVEDHMQDKEYENVHCVAGQSPEPCNHYTFWPKTDCGGNHSDSLTLEHEAWLEKHLGPCPDEGNGRQLVNLQT
ncbi:unnamed protein product [Calypogeia fissa]